MQQPQRTSDQHTTCSSVQPSVHLSMRPSCQPSSRLSLQSIVQLSQRPSDQLTARPSLQPIVASSISQVQRSSKHASINFAAISDSETWCNQQSSTGNNPVVPLPLSLQSSPLGGLPFPQPPSLAPSNTTLASSHNIPASSNTPPYFCPITFAEH